MSRHNRTSGYLASCVRSVIIILLCLAGQCLSFDRSNYAVLMRAPADGSLFTGAVVAANETEYLVATCSHGAAQGARVYVEPHGTDVRLTARPVWYRSPAVLDLSLWAIPKAYPLPKLPPPGKRPEIGDYLVGWGYPGGVGPQKIGGYVTKKGYWNREVGGKGPWDVMSGISRGGDSGTVFWNSQGQPVASMWGSASGMGTFYTSLTYMTALWAEQSQWGPCGQCPPAIPYPPGPQGRIPGAPPGSKRVVEPPPEWPAEAPVQEPTPAEPPPDPECCNENAEAIRGLNEAMAGVTEAVEAAKASNLEIYQQLTVIQDQIASQPPAPDPVDMSPYALKSDLVGLEDRLGQKIDALLIQVNERPEPVGPNRHIVLISDQNVSYWPRLKEYIDRAREQFFEIKVRPPGNGIAGVMPQAVDFVDGTPIKHHVGIREVTDLLAGITRGTYRPMVEQ